MNKSSAIDPVCGMTIEVAAKTHARDHKGRTYYFCSEVCRDVFDADPAKYTSATAEGEKKADAEDDGVELM